MPITNTETLKTTEIFPHMLKTSIAFARFRTGACLESYRELNWFWLFPDPVAQQHTYLHLWGKGSSITSLWFQVRYIRRKRWSNKASNMKQSTWCGIWNTKHFFSPASAQQTHVDINKETQQHCENTSYTDFSVRYPFRATSLDTSTVCAERQETSLC